MSVKEWYQSINTKREHIQQSWDFYRSGDYQQALECIQKETDDDITTKESFQQYLLALEELAQIQEYRNEQHE